MQEENYNYSIGKTSTINLTIGSLFGPYDIAPHKAPVVMIAANPAKASKKNKPVFLAKKTIHWMILWSVVPSNFCHRRVDIPS